MSITIYGARHFDVRMHQKWSVEMPLEMLGDPTYFEEPGNPESATAAFDQWACDNGSVDQEWDELIRDGDLNWEYDFDDVRLIDQWREAVYRRTTTLGFDQWRENLIQSWRDEAKVEQ